MKKDSLPPESDRPVLQLPPGFQFVRELGRGGMGIVALAIHTDSGSMMAVKLLASQALSSSYRARVTRETRILAELSHPNLVACYAADLLADPPYIALEYVPGSDLHACLTQGAHLDPVAVGRKLASVLAYVHERGFLHRDIKPANVLMRQDGQPVLSDLGLAKTMDLEETPATATGTVLGTLPYLDPVCFDGTPPTAKSDVYSLGLVLYEIAAGRIVFAAPSRAGGIGPAQRTRGEIPPLSRFAGGVDGDLERLIMKSVSLTPEERPSSSEMAAVLALIPVRQTSAPIRICSTKDARPESALGAPDAPVPRGARVTPAAARRLCGALLAVVFVALSVVALMRWKLGADLRPMVDDAQAVLGWLDNGTFTASGTNCGIGAMAVPVQDRERYLWHAADGTTYFLGCFSSKPLHPRDFLRVDQTGSVRLKPITLDSTKPYYLLQHTGPHSAPPNVISGSAGSHDAAVALVRSTAPELLPVIPAMEAFFLLDVTHQLEDRLARARAKARLRGRPAQGPRGGA